MVRIECPWPNTAINAYDQVINYPKVCIWYEEGFAFGTNLVQLAPGKLMTFVHIDVFQWSPSMWRRLKHLWSSQRHLLPPIVFASGDVSDAKWRSFVEKLGFEPIVNDCPCSDGNNRPIYAHFRKK